MRADGGKTERPRIFYRGDNPGDTRRIRTGDNQWDSHLFVADNKDAASLYGSHVSTVKAKPEAKILYEGTRDFIKHAAGTKGMNLLQYGSVVTQRAKSNGYDAVWFKRQGDTGTAIINRDKFDIDPATPEVMNKSYGGYLSHASGGSMTTTTTQEGPGAFMGNPVVKHVGPIKSTVAGRTDHLPMHVPHGAYVIPADIISAMGEGNTAAGFKHMDYVFGGTPYEGEDNPYNEPGTPYGAKMPERAAGGLAGTVPIVAAGGEYVLSPEQVMRAGNGDLDRGHRVLDDFVKRKRAETIKTLKALPGPRHD